MFKTNLKIAWRNLVKDRQFTLLNVLGLSTGLACALLIFLWVNDEMSFDKLFANSGFPFTYSFLNEAYKKQYDIETRIATFSKYFAGLAITICCLRLFGLAAFTAQKRRKEIGVRKVVGASVMNITGMLAKDFLRLILLSLLIAFPVSWWLMHDWLQSFAYRIHISASVFLITESAIIIITILTISYQLIKAALANPVKSLSTE